jgi:hypothetical protein
MEREPTYSKVRIVALRRLNNSVNGNPRYDVAFSNGEMHTTSSDAGFCYGITNPEMKGDVDVWLTKAGRIESIRPSE